MEIKENITYDKAKWHFEYFHERNKPVDGAYTYIAMLLNWAIVRGLLVSDSFPSMVQQAINDVRTKKIKASVVLKKYLDGCLLSENFTDEANDFLRTYYVNHYLNDLMNEEAYNIRDTQENYAWIADLLDSRFAEWKKSKSFKAEPVLKTPKLVGFGKPAMTKLLLFMVIMAVLLLFCYWAMKVMFNL